MNINERVERELTKHDLDLVRYQNGQIKDAFSTISNLQIEIVAEIKRAEPGSKRELQLLLDTVDAAIDRTYAAMAIESIDALAEFAVVESQAVSTISARVFRAPIAPKILPKSVALEIVETTLAPNDSLGTSIRERWGRQRDGTKGNIRDGLNYAIQNDQTLDDMLRILRGNRALQFRDGVMAKSKRGAEMIVRTATDAVTNAARLASYQRNSQTISGIQANAVLDSRTTVLCRTRNGYAWHLESGKPFRGTPISFPGPPPWHFNCRTTLSPIFKSLEALQSVLDPELNEEIVKRGEKFPIDGKPAPMPSFQKTFDAMGEQERRRILGPGRLKLYDEGKITLKDLLDQQGRALTLKELTQRYGT